MHKKLATTTKGNAREIYVHHTSLPVIPHVVNLAAYEFYLFEILNYQQQNPSVEASKERKDEQNYTKTRWKGRKTIHHRNANLSSRTLSLVLVHITSTTTSVLSLLGQTKNSRKRRRQIYTEMSCGIEVELQRRGGRVGNVVWLNSHWMINDLQIGLWFRLENLHEKRVRCENDAK